LFEGQTVETDKAVAELGLPLFVKPNDGGSSFGVSKVKEPNQLQPAIKKAFDEGKEVVLESFIKGTEVTCGGYRTKYKTVIFPVTEVVTENEFFDFDAKYNGQVQEITPARISDELTKKIQNLTTSI
jgi:D-alanine-D-alanine ligase